MGADAVRDFMGGSISNREYERRYPRTKGDPALRAIYIALWFGYSDTSEHTMTGKHALNDEGRALVERCVLFLRTDLEFQWPVPSSLCLWYSFLRLVGLGWIVRRLAAQDMSMGDADVWPFLRKTDYEEAGGKQREPRNA
jgi:hypothetical protein